MLVVFGLGLLVTAASPQGALAQTSPQAPRNPVASECLAMAQRLPNARYASLDAPQFIPVAAWPNQLDAVSGLAPVSSSSVGR